MKNEISKEKQKKLTFTSRGGLHVGDSFIYSAQASWPYGRIEAYSNRLVLEFDMTNFQLKYLARGVYNPIKKWGDVGRFKKIPKKIVLEYKNIIGYKVTSIPILSLILGHGIRIVHKNKEYPPYLQMWLTKKKIHELINILESKGKTKTKIKYALMERLINFCGVFVLIYLIGSFVFVYSISLYWFILYIIILIIYYGLKNIWRKR